MLISTEQDRLSLIIHNVIHPVLPLLPYKSHCFPTVSRQNATFLPYSPVGIKHLSNPPPDGLSPERYLSITCLLRSYYLPITKKHFSFAPTFWKTTLSILFYLYAFVFPSVFNLNAPPTNSPLPRNQQSVAPPFPAPLPSLQVQCGGRQVVRPAEH